MIHARSVSRRLLMACVVACAGALAACASMEPPAGIPPVKAFDVSRYEGRWYELARLDHSFERGMTDVSATYQRQPDGSVRVVNRGFVAAKNTWKEAVGKALFTGDEQTASLKVSFFGPFYGGYHVAALDPDYQWSVVVGPDRRYAWILARTPQLPADVQKQIVAKMQSLGIDTQALIWVSHSRTDPKP
ncbi:lipocalin family protein [Aquabacterium sp. G14]|uniref:lipocalin family protein n=1 Tax=Aquabacterium sp. G14 TaxID=3130164 RepID=UPI0030B12115